MLPENMPSPDFATPPLNEPCDAPESRLMIAVLQDALVTYQRGLHASTRPDVFAFLEVDRWFRSRDYDSPFSFESICDCLQINPACVREWLNQWKRRAAPNAAGIRPPTLGRKRVYTHRSSREPIA